MDEIELRLVAVETLLLEILHRSPPGMIAQLRDAMRDGISLGADEETSVRRHALQLLDEAEGRGDVFTVGALALSGQASEKRPGQPRSRSALPTPLAAPAR